MDSKKNKIRYWLYAILAIFLILTFFSSIGIGVYKYNWHNNFCIFIVTKFPYPVAIVKNKFVTYSSWQDRIALYNKNRNFYLTEQDIDLSSIALPDDRQIKQKALDNLIKDRILDILAEKNNIKISNNEIDTAYQNLILQKTKNGEDQIEKSLHDIYGMSISDFKKEVIKKYIIREKLSVIKKEELMSIAQERGEDILSHIKTNKADFSELAQLYSDDSTSLKGGELNYINKGELTSFYENTVWQLKNGEVSGLIKTPPDYQYQGYYIVKVEDKKDSGGEQKIKLRQIFIEASIDKLIDQEISKNSFILELVKI